MIFYLLFIKVCNVSKLLPPGSVDLVSEARVIWVQLRAVGQNLIGKPVQILDLTWKPWHSFWVVLNISGDHLEVTWLILDNFYCTFNVSNSGIKLNRTLIIDTVMEGKSFVEGLQNLKFPFFLKKQDWKVYRCDNRC